MVLEFLWFYTLSVLPHPLLCSFPLQLHLQIHGFAHHYRAIRAYFAACLPMDTDTVLSSSRSITLNRLAICSPLKANVPLGHYKSNTPVLDVEKSCSDSLFNLLHIFVSKFPIITAFQTNLVIFTSQIFLKVIVVTHRNDERTEQA